MYFIQTVPEPMFPDGIHIPFGTEEEALNQAAWDIYDPALDDMIENIHQIYEAKHGEHLNENARKVVHKFNEIKKQAPKRQAKIFQQALEGEAQFLLDLNKGLRRGDLFQNVVPGNAYTVMSGGTATAGAIALVAATAKTVIGVAAGTSNQPSITGARVSFDGVTSSAVPVLIEWVSGTNATNPPGTASTSQTPKQLRGWPSQASQSTAAYNWSTEPTVLEVFTKILLDPNKGTIWVDYPLGREPTGIVTAATQFKFVGLRLTAPAGVNTHVTLEYEE